MTADPAVATWILAMAPPTAGPPLPPWARPHMAGFECRGRWLAEAAAMSA